MLSRAHVGSLEQRARNAHDQNEQTLYDATLIAHHWFQDMDSFNFTTVLTVNKSEVNKSKDTHRYHTFCRFLERGCQFMR